MKTFSSYLSITPLKDVMKPIFKEDDCVTMEVMEDASILEGLKILLEYQLPYLYVVDDEVGIRKGMFSFEDLNYVLY
ncbi:hypothetical protein AZF37_04240 [endosymbiont 'TC1' of Trimyema compressum]|uniref:hypothetical protein n=1 Tax=endosymbiont 'TC1' of Trimyema compressum TaxID=243899 RepID=UPI0007F15E4A|nr:hypothetical protein [endosymbiont 'TC1' of Trimyema compressum]AMP20481.1 hypothetical protein AZF37_04240 [endosymbiont 'TC1' of Trimyema compressum]